MQCDVTSCVSLCNLHIKLTSISRRLRQRGKNCERCSTVIFKVLSIETIIRLILIIVRTLVCLKDIGQWRTQR